MQEILELEFLRKQLRKSKFGLKTQIKVKFFKRLKNIIYSSLLKFAILRDNNNLFYLLFRFRLFIKDVNLKIKKIKIDNYIGFEVTDKTTLFKKRFIVKNQGYLSYHNGFDFRAYDLGVNTYMLDLVKFSPSDVVFDIGANLGDLSLYFNSVNLDIKYYGFEPGFLEFCCLKNNIEDNTQNKIFQIALGEKNEFKTFYYKPENGDSSLFPIKNFKEKVTVEVKTLDTVIEDLGLQDKGIHLLKLEAEGFEPEVIMGCKKYIHKIKYITADLGFERGVNEESTSPQVINYLLQNNFEIIKQARSRNTFLFRLKQNI